MSDNDKTLVDRLREVDARAIPNPPRGLCGGAANRIEALEAALRELLASLKAYDETDEGPFSSDVQQGKWVEAYKRCESAIFAASELMKAENTASAQPLADLGICDICGGQFSDLAGHKSLGVKTHPWLKDAKTDDLLDRDNTASAEHEWTEEELRANAREEGF